MRLFEKIANVDDYIHFLELFSVFDTIDDNAEFVFNFIYRDKNLDRLRSKYDFSKQERKGKQFRSMVQLMIWVFNSLIGNGMCTPPPRFNAEYILDLTKKEKLQSNCFMYAVTLNEIFLSMGYASRMVRCMPIDVMFCDCHCVTEVYCHEYDKWVVFDPANKAYYVNINMIPLNLFELRENIMLHNRIIVPMMGQSSTNRLIQYFTKNLVRFESDQTSRFGLEWFTNNRTLLHFQSNNYMISDKEIDYPQYGIRIKHITTGNPELFWAKPKYM